MLLHSQKSRCFLSLEDTEVLSMINNVEAATVTGNHEGSVTDSSILEGIHRQSVII